MGLIALAAGTARRVGEIGFIIGAIGGLLFIAGAALRANSAREGTSQKVLMAAGVCITVGFVLGIVAFHWGRE
jgi:ABC-type proline/glycine betaine transport system permease subunit